MKRFMILCLLSVLGATAVFGQKGGAGQYLFGEFQNGQVVYKDGRVFKAIINYSLISNRFVFIDDDGTLMELGELNKLDVVTIGGRVFRVSDNGYACEIVHFEKPTVIAVYTGKVTDRGENTGYGGRSQTTSTRMMSTYHSGRSISDLTKDNGRWIVTGVNKSYQVEFKGKMRNFSTMRQLIKIYPKQHRAGVEKFAADNKIDFDSVEQVVKLCSYADSLE